MDLLEHEVLVAAFFCRFRVPGDFHQGQGDFIAVEVIEFDAAGGQARYLQMVDIVNAAGVFEDRRYVRGQESGVFRRADDQGRILPGGEDFVRKVLEHQGQGVAAPHPHHGAGDGVHRADLVFLIVVIHQLDHDLGIGIAVKPVAVAQQLFLELAVIFDDAVVDAHHVAFHFAAAGAGTVAADMGVGVHQARIAVGGPAGVADAAGSRQGAALICFVRQVIQLSGGLDHLRQGFAVPDGQTRRIISPVFQPLEPVQQDGRGLMISRIAYDTAHGTLASCPRFCRKNNEKLCGPTCKKSMLPLFKKRFSLL